MYLMRTLDYVHEFLHKRVVILHRFYGTQLSFAIIIRLESSCGILDAFFKGMLSHLLVTR